MPAPDRRHDLFRSYEHAAAVVEGVEPSTLQGPTPCPDYDVATLVGHLVGVAHRAAGLGRGVVLGEDELPRAELGDAPGEIRRAAKDAEAAWSDDARLEATTTMPWGESYSGYTLVDMYLVELAAHSWDLAASTGQLDRLDEALAPVAHEAARSMLRPEYRNAMGPGNPFASEVEAPHGAGDWDRFAAFMGRDPSAVHEPLR